jgi:hypothetical protein
MKGITLRRCTKYQLQRTPGDSPCDAISRFRKINRKILPYYATSPRSKVCCYVD